MKQRGTPIFLLGVGASIVGAILTLIGLSTMDVPVPSTYGLLIGPPLLIVGILPAVAGTVIP